MAKVLVVDDDEVVRTLIREALADAGHTVHEASDGNQALTRYREDPADVVVMDLIMPEQDGLGAIRKMKQEFGDVRIVAISGGGSHISADFLTVAEKIGAACTFTKPIDVRALIEAVNELAGAPRS